jgi:transposase
MNEKISDDARQLAAMVYGESSTNDHEEEMFAIASVLVRQYKARGYPNISEFAKKETTFSFVVIDGNRRYKKLIDATPSEIEKHGGMSIAIRAATNALNEGPDKSNGAFFWDGADIKSNYKHHFKVRHGIRFSDVQHNIYNISESRKTAIIYKNIKIRNKDTRTIRSVRQEIGRYDHQYVSTAAHGGTIFWKFNPEYLQATKGKDYK